MKTTTLIALILFSSCTTKKQVAKEQQKVKYNQETKLNNKENMKQSEKANEQIKTGLTDNTETIIIETIYAPPDSISGKQYKVSETLTVQHNIVKTQIDAIKTEINENTTNRNEQEETKTGIKNTRNTEEQEIIQKKSPVSWGLYLTVAVSFMLIFVLFRVLK